MTSRRRVAAVTGTRADFGLMRWILGAIAGDPALELQLLVTGAHLAPEFGATVGEIEASGLPIAARIPILDADDSALGTVGAMARATAGVGEAMARLGTDVVCLLGDRYEVFAAGAAATALRVPIVHLCGGETTEGAVDQVWRNALTKMAHRHLVATATAAANVLAMGEEECRVRVVGSPGLESFRHAAEPDRAKLGRELGVELESPVVLLTMHPVTNPVRGEPGTDSQLDAVLAALDGVDATIVATHANADAGGRAVNERLSAWAAGRARTIVVPSLGADRYIAMLLLADAMVGNSSSGVIEAPSAELPVVNVGSRQRGRERAANVIDVEPAADSVAAGLRRALAPGFRSGLRGLVNPYGDGRTSARVVEELRGLRIDAELMTKR